MARYRKVAKRPVVAVVTAPAPDYSQHLKADLVALADAKGIDSSGTKADLIARLQKP